MSNRMSTVNQESNQKELIRVGIIMIALPEYLVPILKRVAEKEGFVNFTTDVGSGTNIGDNFVGELLKIVVSGRQKQKDGKEIDGTLNLLCKLGPASAQRRKEFMIDIFFERETHFYNKVAPAFIRFQQEKGLPDEDQFNAFPTCYEAVYDPENEIYAIVMQDLRTEGFEMWPKQKTTPAANCRLFVRELAKFHAISFAMKDQHPEQFKDYEKLEDLLQVFIKSPNNLEFFSNCYKRAINVLEDEEHKEIMRDISENAPGYIASCLGKGAADRFGVLSHGDCWNNNLLFRADEELGTVKEICFVDWQIIRYASPTTDLLYYLCASIDKKTRDEELGNLFRQYYEQLSSNIRKMGSDPQTLFPYDAFKKELKLSGNIGFLLASMTIEISLVEAKDVSNLDELYERKANGNGDQKIDLIQGLSDSAQLIYKKRLNDCIGDLVTHGYFQKLKNRNLSEAK